MVKRNDILMTIAVAAVLAGCSSNPVTDDQSFDSQRTAEIIPIPVEVDTDLTKVYIKKEPMPPALVDPVLAAAANGSAPPTLPSVVAPEEFKLPEPAGPRQKPSGGKDRGVVSYRVKPFDTLMKISFAVLGDLRRWREIAEQNPGKIGKFNSLTPGTWLKIRATGAVDVAKNGDPYLIRRRDTLIKISDHLYGTPRKWWALWDNNRQLIHDPNRIYAGFTLYYLPDPKKRSFTQDAPKEVVPVVAEVATPEPAVEAEAVKVPVESNEDVARAPSSQDAAGSVPALAPSEIPETAPALPATEAPSAETVPVSGA